MISTARNSDKEDLIQLWREAFSEESYAVRFYENVSFGDILVWRQEESVVSMLHALPCSYVYDGRKFCGIYLYALATVKDYQNKGIMGRLIHAARSMAEEKNLDFLSLIAANQLLYSYYEKFGFCAVRKETKAAAVLQFHKKIQEYVVWEYMQETDWENTVQKTKLAENQMIYKLKEQPSCIFSGKIPY